MLAHTNTHRERDAHTCIFRDTQNEIQRYIWTSYHFSCALFDGRHTRRWATGRTTLQRTFSFSFSVSQFRSPIPGHAERRFLGRVQQCSWWRWKCVPAGRPRFIHTRLFLLSPPLPTTLSRWQNVHWNLRYLPWYYYKRLGPRSGSDPAIIFTVKRIFHTQRVRVRLDVSFRVLSRGRRLRLAFIFACHKMFGDDTASDNANDKPERQPKKETATETERQRQHWNVAASGLHNF